MSNGNTKPIKQLKQKNKLCILVNLILKL
jgi:hypothetical protein